MPDNPHQKIYGLDEAQAFVKENLSTWVDFLQDLANYGSNLIPRCYVSSERTLADTVLASQRFESLTAWFNARSESQRDSIFQPSVGAQRLRWVIVPNQYQLHRSCITVHRALIQLLRSRISFSRFTQPSRISSVNAGLDDFIPLG